MFGASLLTSGLLWSWWLGRGWALPMIVSGIVQLSTGFALWVLLLREEWARLKEGG
jgi:hypothetical protein